MLLVSLACGLHDSPAMRDVCEIGESADFGFIEPIESAATINGETMTLVINTSGGCGPHRVVACWDGQFITNTEPVAADVPLGHDPMGDDCEAGVTRTVEVDLSELASAWRASFPTEADDVLRLQLHDQPPAIPPQTLVIDWSVPAAPPDSDASSGLLDTGGSRSADVGAPR